MDGKSQEEMSLGSVTKLIASIANSSDSIDKTLKKLNFADFVKSDTKGIFNTTKMLVKIKNYAMVQYMKLSEISFTLKDIYNSMINPDRYENVNGVVTINFNGKKYSDAKGLLLKIREILLIDEKKYDKVNDFFGKFNTNLEKLEPLAKKASVSLLVFTGAFLLLNLVSFAGLFKVGTMLVVLGASIGFFISSVVNSLKGQGMGKSFMMMKMLPNFFTAMGKGILLMSLGLMIFSNVKGSAVSLSIMVGVLIGLFAIFRNKRGAAEGVAGFGGGIFNNMMKFSMALGILVLSIYAVKDVPFAAVGTLIGIIIALGIALKITNGFKGGVINQEKSQMFQFAMGLGILILALHAVQEIPITSMIKLLAFIGGLGLVMQTFKVKTSLVGFAFGFGILVLALYAFQTSINIETMFAFTLFMGALGLSLRFFNKSGLLTLGLIAASIYALAASFSKFVESKFGLSEMLVLGGTIVMMAIVAGILGAVGPVALVGAATLGVISLALMLAVEPLQKIGDNKIDINNVLNFMGSIGIIAIGLSLMTPFLLLSVPASALLLPLAGAIYLASGGFVNISAMSFNVQNVNDFIESIKLVANGLSNNFVDILLAVPASIALVPIMVVMLMVGGLMKLIQMIDFSDKTKTNDFNNSVSGLINNINEFGLISLAKAGAKSLLLVPIFGTLLLGAALMKKIQDVELNKDKMVAFNSMVSETVSLISTTVNDNKSKLEEIGPGLEVLGKIFSVGGNIAEVVRNMASLTYNEYRVKNGKLVLHKQHKLKQEDFTAAGKNLGLIINELVKPLNELGADSNTISVGGFVFDNPFKNNDKSKGMDFIQRLGNAYLPLSESLKKMSETGLMTDSKYVTTLTKNIGTVISSYISSIDEAGKIDINKSEKSLKQMVEFNDLFATDNNFASLDKMSLAFERIVNVFSDEKKWKLIRKNLTFMHKEFKGIAKELNSIEIDKINAFENTIKAITVANRGDIQELILKISEFISVIQTSGYNQQPQQPQQVATTNNNTTITEVKGDKTVAKQQNNDNILSASIESLISAVESVKDTLENETLDVNVKNHRNTFGA